MSNPIVLAHAWTTPGVPETPLGIGYLASYLRAKLGFTDIAIVSADRGIVERVLARAPSMVGFYSYTAQLDHVRELAAAIRRERDVPMLLGGPHVSTAPQRLPAEFDIGVVGEGEQTIVELVRLLLDGSLGDPRALAGVNGIAFHDGDGVRVTAPRPLIADVDSIPPPARDLYDQELLLQRHDAFMRFERIRAIDVFTVRGCPYQCTYCQQGAFGHTIRMHSAEYIADEIEQVYKTYRPDGISFSDDLFTVNARRVERLIELLEQRGLLGKLRFRADVRANLVNDRLIAQLKRLNVVSTSIGAETGSERLLSRLKGPGVTVAQTRAAIRALNDADIPVYICMMVGAPDESPEEMAQTEAFLREALGWHRFNSCNVNALTPLPGTPLWEQCVSEGLLDPSTPSRELGFTPDLFAKRTFHICKHISRESLKATLDRLIQLRARKYRQTLLRTNPFGFLRHALRAAIRRIANCRLRIDD
ncbi:MAG: radical SAM protein [Chitinivibrionales bacterium]|nr:radical SAM protein [Chitinivibrionales bacterium]